MYVIVIKIYHLKAKDSEIKPYPLCVGNISKYFTIDNLKKNLDLTDMYITLCFYNTIDVSDFVVIHE